MSTENTTFTCCYQIKACDLNTIPIGKPISNTRVYILDKNRKLLPIGAVGEIYIAGDGVAAGYLNREELNGERFILNPYIPTEVLYKSGDLGRYLPDGNIEFIGRIDHQVKVRGFRIELGEIEAALLRYTGIKNAVVLVKEDKNKVKYLVAYVATKEEITAEQLREDLLKTLPEYLIPNVFIRLDEIPLTANGKVDRRALPEPDGNLNTKVQYVAPRNQVEEILIQIYAELLGVERVGINDNFFSMGGHSLKAQEVIQRISIELNVEIPLRELFITPAVKELAEKISRLEKKDYPLIKIKPKKYYYIVSSAHKRLFLLEQISPDIIAYNMPVVMVIEGEFNLQKLKEAFEIMIKRHESLRTRFVLYDGEPMQQVCSKVDLDLEISEMIDKEKEAIDQKIEEFIQPFELSKAPLLRVKLLKINQAKYMLMLDMHHIISDGLSMKIFVDELIKVYSGEELPELNIQYRDYAIWQDELLKTEKMSQQEEYWLNEFKGDLPILNLASDYSRPAVQSYEGSSLELSLEKELVDGLRYLANSNGATLYMVLLAGYNTLLLRYTGQEDIIIGSPVAGRTHPDLQKVIGMFVNTLAFRSAPMFDKVFAKFLSEVKEKVLGGFENQDYQFEMLIDQLDIRKDLGRNPLFDTMFDLQDLDMSGQRIVIDGLKTIPYDFDETISKFDLNLTAVETKNGLNLHFKYCTKLFRPETIAKMAEHYVNILRGIVANPDQKLGDIPMLSEMEREQILYEFNDTELEYSQDQLVYQLFESYAEQNPDEIVVIIHEDEMTYGELNRKSNQLANMLRNKGVKAETLVGIMVERSFEMVISLLAVFKAGGAYVPIDPLYPSERIEYMLEDSNAEILLTQKELNKKVPVEFSGEVLFIDLSIIEGANTENLESITGLNNLAYVIYTSGSTGRPKGVMIEHGNILNSYYSWQKQYSLNTYRPILLQLASFSFDVFVADISRSIFAGGRLIIAAEERNSLSALYKLIDNYKVNIVNSTPGLLLPLLEYVAEEGFTIDSLRYLLIGADSWHISEYRRLYENFGDHFKIVNCYGVTEAAVDATWFSEENNLDLKEGIVPIGKPIYNVKTYILDKFKNPVPIGAVGEIYIGGTGVARGYLNRPELTQERFIDSPFTNSVSERLYKSGDLGRYLSDGNIEFLGRIDNQVKVRGYRIEIGEIEAQLLKHSEIKQAVVVAKETSEQDKYLVAYFVAFKELTIEEIRKYLAKTLPEYMLPEKFIQLELLPLTPNKKVDLKALPEIVESKECIAPETEVEIKLAEIWQEVLDVERIGRDDNFFSLGGHSLKAIKVMAKIYQKFNVELSVRELFKSPYLKDLAEVISESNQSIYLSIKKQPEQEHYPVSSAQKRLFVLYQFDQQNISYNMPAVLAIEGQVDIVRLENVIRDLITRHESLRTCFKLNEGEPVQQIQQTVEFSLTVTGLGFDEEQRVEETIKEFVKPFDLEKAPLLRVELLKLRGEKNLLLIDMHHIISDGVSTDIILDELTLLYTGEKLPQIDLQYRDFAVWQNELFSSESIRKQEEYWVNQYNGEIPVLNLSTDYPRPSLQSTEGSSVNFIFEHEFMERIIEVVNETGVTLYMFLLAAYNVLLAKYSGQEDIIIGSPVAGRPHPETQKIVGMFVNMLPLRNAPLRTKSFSKFLDEVKEKALSSFENQDYQFEMLVDRLNLDRDMSRNPLFDSVLVVQNLANPPKNQSSVGIKFSDYHFDYQVAKFDLTLIAAQTKAGLSCTFNYATKLFDQTTIERMAVHFTNIVCDVLNNPDQKIGLLDMMTLEEKHQLLSEFNHTQATFPEEMTIHQLFEEQVELRPARTAVVIGDQRLSYLELNERANQVAGLLRTKGVGPDSLVGIMTERSCDLIIGIFGILKAGGAYVPIDPEYPSQRIEYMIKDSELAVILTQSHLNSIIFEDFAGELINLDQDELLTKQSKENLANISTPDNLAYIIYTSGSTGKPKGMMIEHFNVVRLLKSQPSNYDFNENDVWTLFHSYCFDFSVWEIFGALLFGGKLVIVDAESRINSESFLALCKREKVTVLNQTPQAFYNFINAELELAEHTLNEHLRYVIFGGDTLNFSKLIPWASLYNLNGIALINMYGITETTVHVTYERIKEEDLYQGYRSLIGKPIYTTTLYLLDQNGNSVPVGVPGEIYVGGLGVGRGYLNRPELTDEKFIENPFSKGERLYRSGDLGKFLADGNLEYLGRIDHQVKIRGFRIEIGEIQETILKYEAVKDAVVIDRLDKDNNRYLAGYLVAKDELNLGDLKDHLLKTLPDYMVPQRFVLLEKLPLTSNGKVDRKALPEPEIGIHAGAEYVAPRDETEAEIAQIWCEVLQIERVGVNDNFFEIGGNSLNLIKVFKELKEHFPDVELKITDLFKQNSVAMLAEIFRTEQIELDKEDDDEIEEFIM